jgi:hypothetical protein
MKYIFTLLTLTLFLAPTMPYNFSSLNNQCKANFDCNPPYIVCSLETQICLHKSILPPTYSEFIGLCMFIIAAGFAITAGVGGGSVYTPIAITLFYFDSRTAMVLTSGLTVFTCIGKYFTTVNKKDPDYPHMPLINYNLVLVSTPMIMAGSFFGVI